MANVIEASTRVVDISPDKEVSLGCGVMVGDEWKIESPPEISFVALRVPAGQTILLVSIDALYAGAPVRQAIETAAAGVLEPSDILVGASHTHAAPMLDPSKPGLGVPDPEHLDRVVELVADATRAVLEEGAFRPATLSASEGTADHSVNRRLVKRIVWKWPPVFNRVGISPNFRGSRDEVVTVVTVDFSDGSPGATIWNYACHPVKFPDGRTVSTHYPGVVRAHIREQRGEGEAVLFFQGFSGDTRPRVLAEPRIPESPRHFYRRVRFGPSWKPMTRDMYKAWTESLSQRVLSVLAGVRPISCRTIGAARLLVDRRTSYLPPAPPCPSRQFVWARSCHSWQLARK